MSAARNLRLYVPYLVCSVEGVLHGVYLVWLTVHKGLTPLAVSVMIGASEVLLLALEVPTGRFADRVGPRASLMLGSAFQVLGLALFWLASSAIGLTASLLAIAVGDAFRHGADEALLYRSCAARGEPERFGQRVAHAHALTLVALVAMTAGGGWLVERGGFPLAFLLEIAISLLGLALAAAMTDMPAVEETVDDAAGTEPAPLRALLSSLPWARIVPVALLLGVASVAQFMTQTESHARIGVGELGLLIAAAQLLEAAGAAIVARGLVPIEASVMERIVLAAMASMVVAAAVTPMMPTTPVLVAPALTLLFVASGITPAIRSALLQREARDDERATVASAAGVVDFVCSSTSLPLCALAVQHTGLATASAALGGVVIAATVWLGRRERARLTAR